MLITATIKRSGKVACIGWGLVTADPVLRAVGDQQRSVCKCFVNVDTINKGTDKEYESYSVQAWDGLAAAMSTLEKGDNVFFVGEIVKDEYWTQRNKKDEYRIDAAFLLPAQSFEMLLQMLQAFQAGAIGQTTASAQSTNTQQQQTDGFYDYSNLEIPEEFQSSI